MGNCIGDVIKSELVGYSNKFNELLDCLNFDKKTKRLEEITNDLIKDHLNISLLKESVLLQDFCDEVLELKTKISDLEQLIDLTNEENDNCLVEDMKVELNSIKNNLRLLETRNFFKTKEDSMGAIIQINAGAGGTESQDFVQMLMRMYLKWASKHNFLCELIDMLDGNVSGIKNVSILVSGKNVFGMLKGESGVHRMKRNSPHNAQGKRETSFASVNVIPDVDEEIVVDIKKCDYDFQAFRSGGKGGQAVNKISSAVRITHHESGIVVKCQNERSQNENLRIALKLLKAKLFEKKQQEQSKKFDDEFNSNKTHIGFGHHMRTYSMNPTSYAKCELTGISMNVDEVLDGNLDIFIEKLLQQNMKT